MKVLFCFALHLLIGFGIRAIFAQDLRWLSYVLHYALSLSVAFCVLSEPAKFTISLQPVDVKNALKSFGIAVVFMFIALVANKLFTFPSVPNTAISSIPQKFILAVILAPILEELLFRKLYLGFLLNKYKFPQYYAVAVSALLFGLAHFRLGTNSMVYNAIMGVGYGLIFIKFQDIKLCMGSHFLNNFLAFLVSVFLEK